jgi:hypothetical protein
MRAIALVERWARGKSASEWLFDAPAGGPPRERMEAVGQVEGGCRGNRSPQAASSWSATETAARRDFEAADDAVDDLIEIAPDVPCADLVARRGSYRLLVQVRSTPRPEPDGSACVGGDRPLHEAGGRTGLAADLRLRLGRLVVVHHPLRHSQGRLDTVIDSFIAGATRGSTWTTLVWCPEAGSTTLWTAATISKVPPLP